MTLLEKAIDARKNAKIAPSTTSSPEDLREKCELMLAYREGRVFCAEVAEVCGIDAKKVSTYCYNILSMGIRHGVLKIEMVPVATEVA